LLQEHNTQIERQLQHAQKLESLGVLAGGIAHDFNNLLMPVVGYLDLIEDRSGDDAQAVEYVGRMRDAASKLTNLCKQMLTYSGKGHSAKRTLDLNEVLERLKELVRASTSKSMQIDYALHAGLVPVRADETQIDQILINLVMNAAESMDDQPSGWICISTGQRVLDAQALKSLNNGESISPGEYVYVEVRDQGKGIAEADITRLFEPFFTTKFTGRGLGMSVVFGIVRDHAGAIEVESSAGVGTTIRIYFPAATTASQRPDSGPHPALNRRARGLILVVDDEAMVREIVTSMLESAGYEVVCAADGKLGYEAFLAHAPRLAGCVIDVTMPGRDGYDLVRDIRRARDDLPIVLASGYPLRAGYSDTEQPTVTFLQKPFDMHDVINALDSVGDDAAANG
jgi:nitrogen-specific signal transduction histidine kinase/CheY-like chemotaxis protein